MTQLRIVIEARVAGASAEEAARAAKERVASVNAALARWRTPPNGGDTSPSAVPDDDPSVVDPITATAPRVRVV
jgi:hypothetical protein